MAYLLLYRSWIDEHVSRRTGERERRIIEGHGHAEKLFLEKVWYPAFGQFNHLHPEYEVADFRGGSRFLDFAYIHFSLKLAIEIDGYSTHSNKTSRWQFSDSLMRQNFLTIDGWRILRFSYDDVNEKPRMCQQILQQFMGSWLGSKNGLQTNPAGTAGLLESAVLGLALRNGPVIHTKDVCRLLDIQQDKARSILRSMVAKQALLPAFRGTTRVHGYKVNPDQAHERMQF